MDLNDIKIGSRVFYSVEDYDTGKDVIYEGYVIGFNDNQTLKLGNENINLDRFYNISDKPDGDMIVGLQ